ncbi:hypothetical protein E5355_07005 [Bacteroides muris (ex Afrizal et al. 2022)]|uniref:Uncharacterized protein n=1 Tax=Bacteroides muris (ex Afrizal et al. 2022) TaxID=2516960 RepID=A0A4S2AZV8_9BACE|nr:hypothetical protein E5355_07005 [Bacteroides muris (ex Afrizal et al. 2022)]
MPELCLFFCSSVFFVFVFHASILLPACWHSFASLLARPCHQLGKVLPLLWQNRVGAMSMPWQGIL